MCGGTAFVGCEREGRRREKGRSDVVVMNKKGIEKQQRWREGCCCCGSEATAAVALFFAVGGVKAEEEEEEEAGVRRGEGLRFIPLPPASSLQPPPPLPSCWDVGGGSRWKRGGGQRGECRG